MVLGLSGDVWTALGSIAALLGLLLSIWGLRRRNTTNNAQEPPKGIGSAPIAETRDWPPEVRMDPAPKSISLQRIDTGSALLSLIGPAAMYQLDHEEPTTAEEAEQIADALNTIHEWAEADDHIDPGGRVRAGFELTGLIEELGKAGWSVYAATTPRKLVVADETIAWPITTIHVAHTRRTKAA